MFCGNEQDAQVYIDNRARAEIILIGENAAKEKDKRSKSGLCLRILGRDAGRDRCKLQAQFFFFKCYPLLAVINLNIIFYTMAETPKQQFSRFPLNFPPYFPNLNPEQLKHFQANLQRGNSPLPPPPGMGGQGAPLMNPRLYQHFANNVRMMPMPPMWPYMPYNRPPPMPMMGKQGLRNNNQEF